MCGRHLLCKGQFVAVKPTQTHIRLLPQPKSMHSIIDTTQPEQRHGLA